MSPPIHSSASHRGPLLHLTRPGCANIRRQGAGLYLEEQVLPAWQLLLRPGARRMARAAADSGTWPHHRQLPIRMYLRGLVTQWRLPRTLLKLSCGIRMPHAASYWSRESDIIEQTHGRPTRPPCERLPAKLRLGRSRSSWPICGGCYTYRGAPSSTGLESSLHRPQAPPATAGGSGLELLVRSGVTPSPEWPGASHHFITSHLHHTATNITKTDMNIASLSRTREPPRRPVQAGVGTLSGDMSDFASRGQCFAATLSRASDLRLEEPPATEDLAD